MSSKRIYAHGVFSLILIGVYILCFSYIIYMDNSPKHVNAFCTFVDNEGSIIFAGNDWYDVNRYSGISNMIGEHQYSWITSELYDPINIHHINPDDWRSLYDSLLDGTGLSDGSYVSYYIKCHALYDCLLCMDDSYDNYYKNRSEVLQELRLYEPMVIRGFRKFLYRYMVLIKFVVSLTVAFTFVVNGVVLLRYWKSYKDKMPTWFYDPVGDDWIAVRNDVIVSKGSPSYEAVQCLQQRLMEQKSE